MSHRIGLTASLGLLGLIVGACGSPAPSLGDAAAVWCKNVANYSAFRSAAETLGIDPTVIIQVEAADKGVTGATEQQRADYARACSAAFGAR